MTTNLFIFNWKISQTKWTEWLLPASEVWRKLCFHKSLSVNEGRGVYPHPSWWGVLPSFPMGNTPSPSGLDGGTPIREWIALGYAAGGTPLAVSRRIFLLKLKILWKTHVPVLRPRLTTIQYISHIAIGCVLLVGYPIFCVGRCWWTSCM